MSLRGAGRPPGRLAWADVYAALLVADESSSLAGEDLELLATAAHLLGHVEECLRALQRAQQLHAEGGDPRGAARYAFWLAFHLMSRGDVAQANGWLARANRLLEHEPQDCPERGYLLLPVARQQLHAGDHARGQVRRPERSRSAGAPVTPTWLRSRCSSKAVRW